MSTFRAWVSIIRVTVLIVGGLLAWILISPASPWHRVALVSISLGLFLVISDAIWLLLRRRK